MPAIALKGIVGGDEFHANRAAHFELITEFRALRRKVREASVRADPKSRAGRRLPRPRGRGRGESGR